MKRFAWLLVLAFTFLMTSGTTSRAGSQALGPIADGLRITIAATSATVPSVGAEFLISFQNVSKTDFVLNLGTMLANGQVMHPDAVRLFLTDVPAGNTRELQFFDRTHAARVSILTDGSGHRAVV